MKRTYAATTAVVAALALAGCTGVTETTPAAQVTDSPSVIDHEGLARIHLGDARSHLAENHGLTKEPGDCAAQLPDHPAASPVFDDGELVLLWADPPLHTPEGIAVGTPVAEVRETHPDAQQLSAPPETFRFDGLLVPVADRAYLFLHDGATVQKLIVGFAGHVRRLFHDGFGTC